jgi:hypothetical protein
MMLRRFQSLTAVMAVVLICWSVSFAQEGPSLPPPG